MKAREMIFASPKIFIVCLIVCLPTLWKDKHQLMPVDHMMSSCPISSDHHAVHKARCTVSTDPALCSTSLGQYI